MYNLVTTPLWANKERLPKTFSLLALGWVAYYTSFIQSSTVLLTGTIHISYPKAHYIISVVFLVFVAKAVKIG